MNLKIRVRYDLDASGLDVAWLLEKRPCGCLLCSESDFGHWFRFSRLRYWSRCIRAWGDYFRIGWAWWWRDRLLAAVSWMAPVYLATGVIELEEATEGVRRIDEIRQANLERRKERLFLGADSDHPEGLYARGGPDMVLMTNEEAGHWTGRRKG
jgi:hypothetical protein